METEEYAVTFRETREITVWVDATDPRDAVQRARKRIDYGDDATRSSNVLLFETMEVART